MDAIKRAFQTTHQHLYRQQDASEPLHLRGTLPNNAFMASLVSWVLGCIFSISVYLAASQVWALKVSSSDGPAHLQFLVFWIYISFITLFHALEYWCVAIFAPSKLSIDSFVLNNGASYHLAHLSALAEFSLTAVYFPFFKRGLLQTYFIPLTGFTMIAAGQTLRTLAMMHAAENFDHTVQASKKQDHVLVTTGVYSYSRHPSYLGFFMWAVGTQILLCNPLNFVVFAYVTWHFFSARIRAEERYLIQFFGKDYLEYKKKVGTGLPGIA